MFVTKYIYHFYHRDILNQLQEVDSVYFKFFSPHKWRPTCGDPEYRNLIEKDRWFESGLVYLSLKMFKTLSIQLNQLY